MKPGILAMQTTLADCIETEGIGLHSGKTAKVRVQPAEADFGVRFRVGGVEIPAHTDYVTDTRRCTTLGADGASVSTVEHLLSALAGLGIDNADIEVYGSEIPILDGSAMPWAEAFNQVGLCTLDTPRRYRRVTSLITLRVGDSHMAVSPSERYSATVVIDFDHPLIGTQAETLYDDPHRYCTDIAPARTFGFQHEIEALLASNLALGGTLENALVIKPDSFSTPLRVPNECLRHKALDLWGDLLLAGGPILGTVTAVRPGHRANVELARAIAKSASAPSSLV